MRMLKKDAKEKMKTTLTHAMKPTASLAVAEQSPGMVGDNTDKSTLTSVVNGTRQGLTEALKYVPFADRVLGFGADSSVEAADGVAGKGKGEEEKIEQVHGVEGTQQGEEEISSNVEDEMEAEEREDSVTETLVTKKEEEEETDGGEGVQERRENRITSEGNIDDEMKGMLQQNEENEKEEKDKAEEEKEENQHGLKWALSLLEGVEILQTFETFVKGKEKEGDRAEKEERSKKTTGRPKGKENEDPSSAKWKALVAKSSEEVRTTDEIETRNTYTYNKQTRCNSWTRILI